MDQDEPRILHSFFAVTMTSVYHAQDELDPETGEPIVQKIGVLGESDIPLGERLRYGIRVAITARGLIMCVTKDNGMHFIGSHTSPLVALFFTQDEALRCLGAGNLTSCDPRWEKETLEVLCRIGWNHPVFTIVEDEDLRLPCVNKINLA